MKRIKLLFGEKLAEEWQDKAPVLPAPLPDDLHWFRTPHALLVDKRSVLRQAANAPLPFTPSSRPAK